MLGVFARSPQRPRFQHSERLRSESGTPNMVQLSTSPDLDMSPSPSRRSGEVGEKPGSPKSDSPRSFTSLQLALSTSTTTYPGYENYIEDGLICLKHKIRNIEKKKIKLEEYRKRLQNGDKLNQDQLDAVQRYEEVVHNLTFAKELHKTLGALTQDLLRAQKKVEKREQLARMESERKRLCTVLQMQYVLQHLQHERVRQDVLSSPRRPLFISAQELEVLRDLGATLNRKSDNHSSLEDRMMQAAVVYWELLEGKEKPVIGSTYKHMKEWLTKLMDCGYFDQVVSPRGQNESESHVRSGGLAALVKFRTNEVPARMFLNRNYIHDEDFSEKILDENSPSKNWKEEFLALKEQEPPDSWDVEFSDGPPSKAEHTPSREASGFILKNPNPTKKPNAEPKPKAQRKVKAGQDIKTASRTEAPVEVFNSSSSTLPNDPILRKQELEDLMGQMSGSFNFMQESLLDGEAPQTHVNPRNCCASPVPSTPLAQRDSTDGPADDSKIMHSTPLPSKHLAKEGSTSLINGDQGADNWDLDVPSVEAEQEKLQLSGQEGFESPPLFHHKSSISVTPEEKLPPETHVPQQQERESPRNVVTPPATGSASAFSTPPNRPPHQPRSMVPSVPYQTMHPVFKVSVPTPLCSGSYLKPDDSSSESADVMYATASTQTPPELSLPEDHLQPDELMQSECVMVGGGQMYTMGRTGPPYSRGSIRGMGRSSRGLGHSVRSPGGHRGAFDGLRTSPRSAGSFASHSHSMRDSPSKESGHQSNYRHGSTGGQRNNSSAGWSDSSLVSSPELNRTIIITDFSDSAHGDSLSDPPVTPQGPHTLVPVHVYPISQQIRVAFSAARTYNFAPGTLDLPITFDLLHSNVGEMFDMPSGRFACPVSGTYVFIFHILKLAINVPLYINLMRNEEVMVSGYANDGAPDHETASNHAVLQLYHGDQVWLRLHRGAIYGSSWKYSTFSGFLLYQD